MPMLFCCRLYRLPPASIGGLYLLYSEIRKTKRKVMKLLWMWWLEGAIRANEDDSNNVSGIFQHIRSQMLYPSWIISENFVQNEKEIGSFFTIFCISRLTMTKGQNSTYFMRIQVQCCAKVRSWPLIPMIDVPRYIQAIVASACKYDTSWNVVFAFP